MADSVEEVRHEGTLPGKTLSVYCAVTRRYLLYSSSSAFRGPDVELVGAVMLADGRLDLGSFTFQEVMQFPLAPSSNTTRLPDFTISRTDPNTLLTSAT